MNSRGGSESLQLLAELRNLEAKLFFTKGFPFSKRCIRKCKYLKGYKLPVVILINATKQFWYALQNPKWGSKQ